MAGYTRQSIADIINGLEVTAPPLNAEFNRLESAFHGATGHTHSGATGDGPQLSLANLVGYLQPVQGGSGGKSNTTAVAAPTVTDDADDGFAPGSIWINTVSGRVYRCIGNTVGAAVWREVVQVSGGNLISPSATASVDLGSDAARFRSLYLSNGVVASTGAYSGAVTAMGGFSGPLTGAVTGNVTGNLTGNVTGDVIGNLTGNVTSTGNSSFGNLTVNGTIDVTATQIKNVSNPIVGTDAANKAYVDTALDAVIAAAPGTLDTLNELAAALGDDPNFSTTVTNSIASKLPLAGGTMGGNIAMGGNKVTGLAAPTTGSDAVTLTYLNTLYGSTASAANSAAAAEAAYDSFDDRYLGAKTADPTVDNDGNPLLTGALYFNTTQNKMRVRSSGAWNDASVNLANIGITGGTITGLSELGVSGNATISGSTTLGGNITLPDTIAFSNAVTAKIDVPAGQLVQFREGGVITAQVEGANNLVPNGYSIITRDKGDGRYQIKDANGDIEVNASLTFTDSTRQADIRYPSNRPLNFRKGTGLVAQMDGAGTEVSHNASVITREKGDFRYLQLSGGTVAGSIEADGSLTAKSGNLNSWATSPTGNAHLWLRSETGNPRGLVYSTSADTYIRNYASDGLSTNSQLQLLDGDVRLSSVVASPLDISSVVTVARGDARYVRNVRLTGSTQMQQGTQLRVDAPAGGVIYSYYIAGDGRLAYCYYKSIQTLINGTWATITG